jgi:hypothetical protein
MTAPTIARIVLVACAARIIAPPWQTPRRPDAPLVATRRDLTQRTEAQRVIPDEIPITKLSGIPPWLAVHHTEQGEEAMLMKPMGDESVPIEESSIPLTEVFAEGVDRLESSAVKIFALYFGDGNTATAGGPASASTSP